MGVLFFKKGKIDVTRKPYSHGFRCVCGAIKTSPGNARRANDLRRALDSEALRDLYRKADLSYGLPTRLASTSIRHNYCPIDFKDEIDRTTLPLPPTGVFLGVQFFPEFLNLTDLESEYWDSMIRDDPNICIDLYRYEGQHIDNDGYNELATTGFPAWLTFDIFNQTP